jgi:hypothetical protein
MIAHNATIAGSSAVIDRRYRRRRWSQSFCYRRLAVRKRERTLKLSIHSILFIEAFVTFAYFHQGGGWNQNGRFAVVRSIVEEGHFWADSYLIYGRARPGDSRLQRVPIQNGEFFSGKQTIVLVWRDAQNRFFPVNPSSLERHGRENITFGELNNVAVSGDMAFARGHFYPNKAPGTSFIAVPAYWLVYHLEKFLGANPDEWWTLTLNAWLISVLSIGLLSAISVVLFYDLALAFSGGRATLSLAAAIAFGFGTMLFPYATTLYEHNIIAAGLLASFYLLYRVKTASAAAIANGGRGKPVLYLFISGICAGYAAITNYIIAFVVAILGGYLLLSVRRPRAWLWFGLGMLGPLLLVCTYNQACFGTPFTINYQYQNPLFLHTGKAFLDVFVTPRTFDGSVLAYLKQVFSVLLIVLISPFRGLFFNAPVLLMSVVGLVDLFRRKDLRAEAWLVTSVLLFFLLFISHFNGWYGGWASGPRYLVPALPFLCVPMVLGFVRLPKLSLVLTAISVAIQFLITAVDAQAPVGVAGNPVIGGLAVEHDPRGNPTAVKVVYKDFWKYSPFTDYVLPLFVDGRAWPLIHSQRDFVLAYEDLMMQRRGFPVKEREAAVSAVRNRIDENIQRGDLATLVIDPGTGELVSSNLSTFAGPVSANPMGLYEGSFYGLSPPHSTEARWNSFNLGEFLFPQSRLSLLPLMLVCGVALIYFSRRVRNEGDCQVLDVFSRCCGSNAVDLKCCGGPGTRRTGRHDRLAAGRSDAASG